MCLVLASSSPRRKELLDLLGCTYVVAKSDYEEKNDNSMLPSELVIKHASAKALDVAKDRCEDVVIGADTIVVLDNIVFGKPCDEHDAERMLNMLSGKVHEVYTGVAVVSENKLFTDYAVTKVKMRNLKSEEVRRYIQTKEPLDKAGAYGIQGKGALLVESIQGCYYNVVGLPLVTLDRLLNKAGVTLL